MHSKQETFINHKVVPYVDLQSGKIDIRKLQQKKYCKVHDEQVVRFFCETCRKLICHVCTTVDHPAESHTVVNLESTSNEQKTEIEQLTRSFEESKKKIEDAYKNVDIVSEQLDIKGCCDSGRRNH